MLGLAKYSMLESCRTKYLVHGHVNVAHGAPRLQRGQDLVVHLDPGIHLMTAWYWGYELQA